MSYVTYVNRSYHQYSIIKIIIYITRQGVLIAILVKVCVFCLFVCFFLWSPLNL